MNRHTSRGRHVWVMISCIPLILIALALVATGVAGAGFVVVAAACAVMMAVMMGRLGARRHQSRLSSLGR